MANKKHAVFAFLATASIGAVWCGALPLQGVKVRVLPDCVQCCNSPVTYHLRHTLLCTAIGCTFEVPTNFSNGDLHIRELHF